MSTAPEAPSKKELLQFFQELKSAAKAYRQALARVAFYGWRIKANESWGDLGYEDEEAMRAAIDIPESTYYRYVRIGGILRHLTLAELEAIKPRNLDLLCQVSADQWPEHDWVTEARTLDPDALCELITTRNRASGNGREPMVRYAESVPFSSQQMIKQAVTAFQEKHELASPGRALELMIAEQFNRTSYLGSLIKIRRLLAEFTQAMKHFGCTKCGTPILDVQLYNELEDIRNYAGEVCTEALEKARQGTLNADRPARPYRPASQSRGQDGTEEAEVDGMAGAAGDLSGVPEPNEVGRGVGV